MGWKEEAGDFIVDLFRRVNEHLPGGVVGKNALALYITIPICLLIFWLSPTLIGLGVIAIIMVPVVLQIILSYRDAGTENAIALLKQMASKQGQIPINEPVHPPPVQLGGPVDERR